jgi:class 3 adenylate cyclase
VAGLPDPRPDHAVAMVRFARDCQLKMTSLSNELEVALGPDTAELAFRIGIHSGAVTGGVLRGQNSRFQLFGKPRFCMTTVLLERCFLICVDSLVMQETL